MAWHEDDEEKVQPDDDMSDTEDKDDGSDDEDGTHYTVQEAIDAGLLKDDD